MFYILQISIQCDADIFSKYPSVHPPLGGMVSKSMKILMKFCIHILCKFTVERYGVRTEFWNENF